MLQIALTLMNVIDFKRKHLKANFLTYSLQSYLTVSTSKGGIKNYTFLKTTAFNNRVIFDAFKKEATDGLIYADVSLK